MLALIKTKWPYCQRYCQVQVAELAALKECIQRVTDKNVTKCFLGFIQLNNKTLFMYVRFYKDQNQYFYTMHFFVYSLFVSEENDKTE